MFKEIYLVLLASFIASCSAREINPRVSSEYDRSMLESFGLGLGSIAAGASAPVTCGAFYTLWPLQHLQGQGATGIYFLPFTGLFGVIVGTARAVLSGSRYHIKIRAHQSSQQHGSQSDKAESTDSLRGVARDTVRTREKEASESQTKTLALRQAADQTATTRQPCSEIGATTER